MSNNQVVIETLQAKIETLKEEKRKLNEKYDAQIQEIEEALTIIGGGTVYAANQISTYDDENPDYIRGTEDGI